MIYQQTDEVTDQWLIEIRITLRIIHLRNPTAGRLRRRHPDPDRRCLPRCHEILPVHHGQGAVGDTVEMSFSQSAGPEYDQNNPAS